jgi:hypothetical protein
MAGVSEPGRTPGSEDDFAGFGIGGALADDRDEIALPARLHLQDHEVEPLAGTGSPQDRVVTVGKPET